jgi:methylated-DNA-[protein]-cysteine S-methyltransferase
MTSPIGDLMVATSDSAVHVLDYDAYVTRMHELLARRYGAHGYTLDVDAPGLDIRPQLAAYFAGDLHAVDQLVVDTGGTPFQQRVWQALRTIAAGTTATYAMQAHRIGHPTATRAVGRTNGLNPIAIILPCHRVVGSNGALTGYAGGLERKSWLLRHEGWSGVRVQSTLSL